MTSQSLPWSCPVCHHALLANAGRLACQSCGGVFPCVGRVPILLHETRQRLSTAAASLGTRLGAIDNEVAALARAADDPRLRFRVPVLAKRREGLIRNRAIIQAELGDVLEGILRGGGPLASDEPTQPGEALGEPDNGTLHTDWGHSPEGEAEIAEVCALALELAGEPVPGADLHPLFLGAGNGRHAFELSRHLGSGSAIDISIDRMWLFDQLLQRPLELAAFEDGAPRTREELTRLYETEPPKSPPGLQLAVADARQLPLLDGSVTHAFSIYFTDMVPLGQLLPEVARVLSPGGAFLHVGPLHYSFPDAAWRLAPDELPTVFREFGLEIEQLRERTLERGRSNASGAQLTYRALAFRARKTA